MEILQSVVVILFFLVCAVLIFLVLIQSGKGGSMGIMGGGGSQSAFGSSTVDVVEKATWYAAIAFFVLAILAAVAFADSGPNTDVNPAADQPAGQEAPAVAPEGSEAPAPAQP
ncbi:MAG: preprotein translocase subunit SecG [Leptospiraceae bacterium]|nr:preprotein translocase subunit SecG [Leptospiraceae bacterium]